MLIGVIVELLSYSLFHGGHASDLVVARNCCMARMLRGETELVPQWTGLPGREKTVQRYERSNGLDTALYKKLPF